MNTNIVHPITSSPEWQSLMDFRSAWAPVLAGSSPEPGTYRSVSYIVDPSVAVTRRLKYIRIRHDEWLPIGGSDTEYDLLCGSPYLYKRRGESRVYKRISEIRPSGRFAEDIVTYLLTIISSLSDPELSNSFLRRLHDARFPSEHLARMWCREMVFAVANLTNLAGMASITSLVISPYLEYRRG